MKVALVTDGIYPFVVGGMQRHSYYMARYLAMHEVHVIVYHTAPDLKAVHPETLFSGSERKYLSFVPIVYPKRGKLPGHYVREMKEYSELVLKDLTGREADLVYVQGLCGAAVIEKKNLLKAKVGVNFHGLEMFQKAAGVRTWLEQFLFRATVRKMLLHADVVFSLGGKLTNIISSQGVEMEKIAVLPIGVDSSWINSELPGSGKIRKFVFVGRYERRKGIEELNQVLKTLPAGEDWTMDFIGAIPDGKKIQTKNITYHGSITDSERIKKILRNADVLVCPSYSEGMPTVILEAMASGLAIIATNVGAVSEQVDNTNGQVIEPGNSIELEKTMRRFISMSPEELNQLRSASVQKLKGKFLWDDIILRTIQEFRSRLQA